MKNVKNVKTETAQRYFEGNNLGDLIFEMTQIFMDDSNKNDDDSFKKLAIIPVNPEPFKLWWEFYCGDVKTCTIKFEAQEICGTTNLCWLEWHNDYDGSSLEDLYESIMGFPDWVETVKDENLFFHGK